MAFKVQIPDGSWHSTEDLTGAELEAIETVTGYAWSTQNPLRNIASYRAIVGAFALRDGMETAELVEWFNTRTAADLSAGVRVVHEEEDDLPENFVDGLPKAEGGPSTSTSAGSPSDTDGPPTS